MEVVVLSGGFDPVHDGHVEMFKAASLKYDYVIVGLNSDEWLKRKKGQPFMDMSVRKSIIAAMTYVDEIMEFDDSDGTCIDLLNKVADLHTNVTFGNGGDRADGNFPESDFCVLRGIAVDDTLGGTTKINSSSDFLAQWRIRGTKRDWGEWKVLNNYNGTTKVKELVVLPGEKLSWQSHEHRSELWFVREGVATVYHSEDGKDVFKTTLKQHETLTIPVNHWHQLCNDTEWILSVIEVQYGDNCVEYDIVRAPRPRTRDEQFDTMFGS